MREWGGGADMAAMRERAAQHAPLQLLGTHGLFGLAAAGGSGLDALWETREMCASAKTVLFFDGPRRWSREGITN